MNATFPYLSLKNIGRLFSRQKMALKPGTNGGSHDHEEIPHLAPVLKSADARVLEAFGKLAARCLAAPAAFICTPQGDMVWQQSAFPIELNGLRGDILTHVGKSSGMEVAVVTRPGGEPQNGSARCCAVAPLRIKHGDLVGALCVVDNKDRSLTTEEKDFLKTVASQLIEELELEETVHECSLCHGAIQTVGRFFMCQQAERWLGQLATKLAELAQVEYAVIMERSPKQPAVARTLAVSFQGGLLENFDYPLDKSPLAATKPGDLISHPKDAQKMFGDDAKLRELKIEGFAAVALPSGSAAEHAGAWILLMDRKALANPPLAGAVLGAAACPLAARLEQVKLQNILESELRKQEKLSQDAAGRAAAEELFRASEARFQALFQHAHAGFALVDPKKMIMKANPAFARLLGYAEPELHHKSLSELGEEAREEAGWFEECASAKRDEYQVERRLQRKDKSAVWVRLTVTSVRDKEGRAVSLVVMAEDLTPQKEADESLRSKDALWHAVFENATLGVALLDRHGKLMDSNPALREIIGAAELKKSSKTVDEFVHEEDRSACAKMMEECVSGKRDHAQMECRLSGRAHPVWVLLTLSAARQSDGSLRHLAAMFEDITLRKEAEKALADCDEPVQRMLDQAGVSMAFMDETGRLKKANGALQELLGYSAQSLLSKSLEDLIFPEDRKGGPDLYTAGKTGLIRFEKRMVRKDRSHFWASLSVIAIQRTDGSPLSMIVMVEDTTDRRKMEEALRLSHQRMDALFEAEGWASSFLGPKGEFTNSSLSFQKLLGYSASELKMKSFSDLAHEEDRETLKKHESVLAQGKFSGFELECRLVRKNGGVFWARINVSRIPGQQEMESFIGVVEDITLRKESVEALTEIKGRYGNLFEHSMFGVALINPSGFLMATNSTFEDMLGQAKEVLHGKLFTERVFGEDMPAFVASKDECMNGARDGFQMEVRLLGRSQELIWVRLKAAVVRKPDGSMDCMVLMAENLTAWKETEQTLKETWEKLRASEEKAQALESELSTEQMYFRVLFDGAGAGIVLLDRDDVMLEVNPAFERMLGYESGELTGKRLEDVSHPDDNKLSAKCHRQCLDGQLPHYEIERCLRAKEGNIVWVRVTVATITRPDGSMESAYATFEDIMPRKNAEMALAASQSKLHLAETERDESRTRLKDVFGALAVGAAVFDKDGRLSEVNKMLEDLFGMRAEELTGRRLADLVRPDEMGDDAAAFQECVDGKRLELKFEKKFVKADKSEFTAELAMSVVRDEDGVFKYAVGVFVPFAPGESALAEPEPVVAAAPAPAAEASKDAAEVPADASDAT